MRAFGWFKKFGQLSGNIHALMIRERGIIASSIGNEIGLRLLHKEEPNDIGIGAVNRSHEGGGSALNR